MKTRELQGIIEDMAPLSLQEDWDNSGWQILLSDGPDGGEEINSVLVAMEVTSKVIEEASCCGADVIVAHHPLIFGSLNKIDRNDITGNLVIKLIESDISVYASHTPFDKCEGGNNDYLAGILRLLDISPMKTDLSGYCREGFVDGECSIGEYIEQVCSWLRISRDMVSFCGDLYHNAGKIGLCTGAGSEFIHAAKEAGCDLFITGDVKYHMAQTAKEMGLNVLDIGHYGSEKIFTDNMASYLRNNCDIEIIKSTEDLNPFLSI